MVYYLEAILKMLKSNRCFAFLLVLALLCGMIPAAQAEVVTLGIYFCGRRTAADGTENIVRLEGTFRVLQNGEEAGTIEAGKETLTLTDTERIRIVPLAETIDPEWDLSNAACDVTPEAGSTYTVPVIVEPLKEGSDGAPVPVSTEEPETDTDTIPLPEDEEDGENGEDYEDEPEMDEDSDEEPEPEYNGAVATPTMPPYDLSMLAPTPEPEWKLLAPGDAGIRVYAYYDVNNNGLPNEAEKGVSGVTVCLFTDSEEAVASVATGPDGFAEFSNVPAGNYRIKAILPRGWAFNKKSRDHEAYASLFGSTVEGEAMSDAFAVSAGTTAAPGISLGKCLHVSGTCWFEQKVDGLFADDEAGLPGVKIELEGEKNGLLYQTVSDENGNWYIDRVQPAAYKLRAYTPDGMMFTRAASKNGRKNVIAKDGVTSYYRRLDLNDKESKDKQYIGFTWSGAVRGICFQDANYNGIYDEGDLPMAGVKVTAIKQAKDEEAAVTYSGEDGTYVLNGLRANTYKMRAVLPDDGSDFTRTVSDPLGNHFAARPGRRENFWPNFELASSEQREMNVGAIYPATVTGYVYMDNDFSGTKNGKEKIVSGYLVKLLDADGNTVAMDKTSAKGKFELKDVPPGAYTLSVNNSSSPLLKEYAFTRLGEGNVILNKTNGEGYSEQFILGLGEHRPGMDIGLIKPGTIQGSVFADRNDNGVRDGDENGLSGVTVRLMGEEGEAFSSVIGEDGRYLFDAVMPGTYTLEYVLPEHAVFARTPAGGNTITGEGTGTSAPFTMNSGDEKEGPVCGALTLGRIEGTAWMDHDGDGVRTDGEETADSLTVTLTPSRSELEEITVTTGEDGTFQLKDLRPDNYTLTVSCPEQYVLSRTDHVDLPLAAGKDSQSVQLPVIMGAVWSDQALGMVMPASLSGQFWLDENNNGLFDDDEQTPAGYEITVTDDKNGKVFDILRTDEEGRFATSGMIPGSFTLSYGLDEQTVAPKEGSSDFREENGKLVLSGISLAEDEERSGLLLGIVRYTAIGGTAWIDRGGSVEKLAGTAVSLLDGSGEVLRTVTTGENGTYKFDKLMPGYYQLDVTVPEGCVIIEPGDRRLNGDQVSVITDTLNRKGTSDVIDLKMAQDQLQMDIGCVLPGRMGDFCWLDLDGDGLQGMDEPGIPNVKITLTRDGAVVAETETDQYGFYRFNDLYPASYTLQVAAPAEVKPTTHRTDIPMIISVLEENDGTTCESVEIQVESDKANYNADIGFVCRKNGVYPAGVGEGKQQKWVASFSDDD